jgi:hypothetical protein
MFYKHGSGKHFVTGDDKVHSYLLCVCVVYKVVSVSKRWQEANVLLIALLFKIVISWKCNEKSSLNLLHCFKTL